MYPPLTTRLYAIRVHFLLAYIVELLLVLLVLIQTGLLGYTHNYDESRRGQRREPLIEVCICFDFSDAVGRGGVQGLHFERDTGGDRSKNGDMVLPAEKSSSSGLLRLR